MSVFSFLFFFIGENSNIFSHFIQKNILNIIHHTQSFDFSKNQFQASQRKSSNLQVHTHIEKIILSYFYLFIHLSFYFIWKKKELMDQHSSMKEPILEKNCQKIKK